MALIHVLDKQKDSIIATLNSEKGEYLDAVMTSSLDNKNVFDFVALQKFDKLEKRNRLLVEDVDGFFSEYIIMYTDQYKRNEKIVRSDASFIDLKKAKVIEPQALVGQTPVTAAEFALIGTEWQIGDIDFVNIRTITIADFTDPYTLLKLIASTFDLELRFRVSVQGNKIVGRYVDLKKDIGKFEGKEITFGKDLIGVKRIEDSSRIVTALLGVGPEREDGSRLTILVENQEALQRWGRKGKHLIELYEPQTDDQNMSESRLRTLTENELEKRIDAAVSYECEAVAMEHVFGKSHERIRLGHTVRIKDDGYTPPLYVEARIKEIEVDPATRKVLKFKIGNFIEYKKEDLEKQVKLLKQIMSDRLSALIIPSITSSAGNIFKNGIGITELTANAFLSGLEYDADGTKYTYTWSKHDKTGNLVPSFIKTGKTITVTASEIDEKATYVVMIRNDKVSIPAEITISNVFDGADGKDGEQGIQGPQGVQGPKGADGQSLYTWVKYADSPTSGMSDYPTNKKYIGLAYNKTTPVESANYADYQWAKIEGDQGAPGAPGTTTYTWVKYADDDKGAGMSDSPVGKRYLGLAYNKTTQTESTNPADYSWSPLYDNVQVGGVNLFDTSGQFGDTISNWYNNGGGISIDSTQKFKGFNTIKTVIGGGIVGKWYTLENNVEYTYAVMLKSDTSFSGDSARPLHLHAGLNNVHQSKYTVLKYNQNYTAEDIGKYKLLYLTFKLKDDANSFKPFVYYGGTGNPNANINIAFMTLVKGNIPLSDWSPSIADVEADAQAKANKAEQNANNYTNTVKTQLQKDITDVNNSVTTLDNYVDGAFKDGLISNAEATAIEKYLNTVNLEKTDLDGRYTEIYNNIDLTNATIKTDLYNKKVAYNSAHTNLINAINTAIADGKTTLTEKQDVDSKFASYRTALANLTTAFEKALTSISQKQADTAKTTAINTASTDATNKANSALSSANTYTNNKDTALRDGLSSGGVTVNSKALQGLIEAGKLDLSLAGQVGLPFTSDDGVWYGSGKYFATERFDYVRALVYTFVHDKRYITARIFGCWSEEPLSEGKISDGRCDYYIGLNSKYAIVDGSQGSFTMKSTGGEQGRTITIDLGAPTKSLKDLHVVFKCAGTNAGGSWINAQIRIGYFIMHD